ncbi:phosphatase PAP2 family protein, partial [Streptomyces sp. NPDC002690]
RGPTRSPSGAPARQHRAAAPDGHRMNGALSSPGRWRVVAALGAGAFAVLATVIAARHGAPYPLEEETRRWAIAHRPPPVTALARAVTATGTGPTPYLCAAASGLAVGRGTGGRLLAAAGATSFLLLAQGTRYGVMFTLARPRPPVADWATHASGYAFPSGHATTSALAAGLLAWAVGRSAPPRAARLCWCALTLWAGAVGVSRALLTVHWPADVIGGWLFALTWLAAAGAAAPAVRTRLRASWRLPVFDPGARAPR